MQVKTAKDVLVTMLSMAIKAADDLSFVVDQGSDDYETAVWIRDTLSKLYREAKSMRGEK